MDLDAVDFGETTLSEEDVRTGGTGSGATSGCPTVGAVGCGTVTAGRAGRRSCADAGTLPGVLDTEELLAEFTSPRPYTMGNVADAPAAPGVHLVLDGGVVVYVGYTGNLCSRLRQHLTGNRDTSMLHDQVGQLLDAPGRAATRDDNAGWLGRCEVRWLETDHAEGTKDALVLALRPRFNRQVPRMRR